MKQRLMASAYPKSLNTRQAERLIADIANDSQRIKYSHHALERMEERSVSMLDVERILKKVFALSSPDATIKDYGNVKLYAITAATAMLVLSRSSCANRRC